MNKGNDKDYSANLLQEQYFKTYEIKIDAFADITFKAARMVKDTKRN